MRYLMLVKTAEPFPPMPPALRTEMGKLAEEMFRTGKMIETAGLLPTAASARIRLSGGHLTVTDGPFGEAKEVIGGYAIMNADSMAEAIDHGRRFMQVHVDTMGDTVEMELDIRPIGGHPAPA